MLTFTSAPLIKLPKIFKYNAKRNWPEPEVRGQLICSSLEGGTQLQELKPGPYCEALKIHHHRIEAKIHLGAAGAAGALGAAVAIVY